MHFSPIMWPTIVGNRDSIERAGKIWTTCWFHADGESPEHWSMMLGDDGWYHCFGCGEHGSYIHAIVTLQMGCTTILKRGERSGDPVVKAAYRMAFEEAEKLGLHTQIRTRIVTETKRSFTDMEREYIQRSMRHLFHPALLQDDEAQMFLEGRGIDRIPPIVGVIRPNHWRDLVEIAIDVGDAALTNRVSYESLNYPGSLGAVNMLVWINPDGSYWQGRWLTGGHEHRYYNPRDVKKRCMHFAPYITQPVYRNRTWITPHFGGEGVLKGLWLTLHGCAYHALMDANIKQWTSEDILPIRVWLQDDDRAGRETTKRLKLLEQTDGRLSDLRIMTMPYGKDADGWAAKYGSFTQAAAILRGLY